MSSVSPSQVGDASRVALARLALDVVSTTPGVAGTHAGPAGLCVTADPPVGVLRGVSVIAQPDGRYEVDLCLIARMVPLVPLGDEIRRRLRGRAAREGLADQLGSVNVEFAGALSAGETIVEVSTGSQLPGPPIPAAGPSALPEEPPSPSDTPLPPPAPPPPTPPPATAPPVSSAEPTGSTGPQTPAQTPPDPAGAPKKPHRSKGRTPAPDGEPRS